MNRRFSSGKTQLIGRGIVYPVPIPLDAAAYKGAFVAGLDPDDNKVKPYFSDGTEWTLTIDDLTLVGYDEEDLPNPLLAENLRRFAFNNDRGVPGFVWEDEWKYLTDEARVAEIAEDVAGNVVRVVAEEIVRTVGPGGDFPELSDAVAFFGAFSVASPLDIRFLGRIILLSGYQIAKPVRQLGTNLGWVLIESEDEIVDVLNSAYLLEDDGSTQDYTFYSAVNSIVPQMRTLLNCANTLWDVDLVNDPASPAFGNRVVGITLRGSTFLMPYFTAGQDNIKTGIRNFSINVFNGNGGFCRLIGDGDGGDFTGAKWVGLENEGGGIAIVRACAIRGDAFSVLSADGGTVLLSRGNLDKPCDFRRTAGVDSTSDLRVLRGGNAVVRPGCLGGLNQRANTITALGTISDERTSVVQSWPHTITNANGRTVRYSNGEQISQRIVDVDVTSTSTQTFTLPAAAVGDGSTRYPIFASHLVGSPNTALELSNIRALQSTINDFAIALKTAGTSVNPNSNAERLILTQISRWS